MVDKDDELAEERDEELERVANEERELAEVRERREVLDATAETTEAIRLAEANEAVSRRRDLADTARHRAREDRAHGTHLLDEAAARPDEPGADATAAAGRRYQRAAESEDRIADRYEQAPASDAARRPAQPPEARKFVQPRKTKKREKNAGLDLEL